MKRIIYVVMLFALVAGCVSCASSKKAKKAKNTPLGMVEDVIPMSGAEYKSDNEYFRAVQSGVSSERSTAQKIAMQNCRQELASSVHASIQAVMENYVKSLSTEESTEHASQYQELAYTVVNQQLADVRTVDEKIYRQDDGTFRYYVCLQMSKSALEKALADKLANDAKINLEFDRERFKILFDSKMAE